ncbi:lambda-crystallin-like [Stylophora pistillata]|nr:lambda-crystallin-like [Stylophora pistillata]XP_022785468.1 lambda-crystallin-like [Stylophora pistillata]
MATSNSKGKVAIIGSGLIGRSWSVIFSSAGFNFALYDTVASQLTNALTSIESQLHDMEIKGLMRCPGMAAEEAFKLVTSYDDLVKALDGAMYVQECTPENLDLKKKVFENLDRSITSDDVILASSTSCIVPSKFTEALKHRSQCIVAHPINPPYYVPLVEVVPAPWTDSKVTDQTVALMKQIGQSPVVTKKEVNGFVLNRLQYAVIMESWRLVEDGICTPEDIETAVTDGLGLRYALIGPFETMHLNANGIRDYCERYGENIVRVCEEEGGPRKLAGATLDKIEKAFNESIPLDQLNERRNLRDKRLAALAQHKHQEKSENGAV